MLSQKTSFQLVAQILLQLTNESLHILESGATHLPKDAPWDIHHMSILHLMCFNCEIQVEWSQSAGSCLLKADWVWELCLITKAHTEQKADGTSKQLQD